MSVQRPVKAQLLREDQANPWKDEAQKWYQPPLPNAILQRLNDRAAVPAATEAELARGVTVEERLGKRAAAPAATNGAPWGQRRASVPRGDRALGRLAHAVGVELGAEV